MLAQPGAVCYNPRGKPNPQSKADSLFSSAAGKS